MNRPIRRRLSALVTTVAATLTIASPVRGASQSSQGSSDSTVRIVPGPGYHDSSMARWFFGEGYRRLWSDTLTTQVLQLESFGGGLTPVCSPPSLLTSDLLLEDQSGTQFRFRSLDKPLARYLPRSLQNSLASQLVQDVISSDHPASQIVAPPIYQALGIVYPDASLTTLPDDGLGDFTEEFAGLPGTLSPELVPGSAEVPGLAPIVEIITTQELWERTRVSEDVVDARAYLTSRLLDVLVGAWGVDFNRLRWGRTAIEQPRVWHPIPWDRDHAFSVFDGFSRWYVRFYLPQLVRFREEYPSIYGLTRMASPLDRRYLAELELATWDSVVTEVQTRLTDSLIDQAVLRMPPEMFQQNGADLTRILKVRRDRLREAAEKYYRILAEWAEVHATGARDLAEVERLSDDRLQIRLWHWDGSSGGRRLGGAPYFSRTFRRDETREIRLFLDGNRDSVVVRGEGKQNITLRVIGGPGNDAIDPPSSPETELYDMGDVQTEDELASFRPRFGGHLTHHRTPKPIAHACTPEPPKPSADLSKPVRDWGSVLLPIPAFGYVSGLGVYAGAGVSKTVYGFRKFPFKSQHALWGGYASTPNSFFARYYSEFREVVGPFGGFLGATASGVANPEFYGLGNETASDQPNDFYQIEQTEGIVTPLVTLNPKAYTQIALGAYFRHSSTATGTGNIIDSLQPFGSGVVSDWGGAGWFRYNSYNDNIATPSGIQLNVNGMAGTVDGDSLFATLSADILGFTSTDRLPGHPTLAVRVGGEKNWGAFPFYAAAFLGGTDNLKGYAPNRFGGDASAYLNTELRVFLAELSWPLRANFGILGIADVGRVWLSGESSNLWHTGFGGGIWLGLFRSGQGLSLALVDGESLRLYISTGFILKKKRVR